MPGITHPFVSAVPDTNLPAGAVGPNEWNAAHTVDVPFLDLNDTPNSYSGEAGKFVKVNSSGNALVFSSTGGGDGSGFPNLAPSSPNTMDDEFDDTSGMSGPVNGLNARWALRGGTAPTITYLANTWAKFDAGAVTFGYEQAKPAAQDYTVAMRFSIGGAVGTSNSFGGLYMIDSVNGDMYAFYYLIGNNNTRLGDLEVSTWGNSATFFGGAFANLKQLANTPPPTCLRVVYTNSSTGIAFEASYDGGLNWVNIWSVAADLQGHTHVGFFKTANGSGNMDLLAVDWFRRTA